MLDDKIEPTFDTFDHCSSDVEMPSTPGTQLRRARELAGLSIADVAKHTRIVERHLEAIEYDDYADIHASIYAVGFARSFARFVSADEQAIAAAVREQYTKQPRPRFRL